MTTAVVNRAGARSVSPDIPRTALSVRGGDLSFAKAGPVSNVRHFMLSFLLKRFSGRHYKKFLEKARPVVARINELEKSYQSLTDEQLRAKTDEFRARIAAASDKRAELDAVLPEAFAAVKNAARRLVGQKVVVC